MLRGVFVVVVVACGSAPSKPTPPPAPKCLADEGLDHGAMTCRMYALHIENGDLPPADPERIKDLMRRACDTGDDDACGHDTASETFH